MLYSRFHERTSGRGDGGNEWSRDGASILSTVIKLYKHDYNCTQSKEVESWDAGGLTGIQEFIKFRSVQLLTVSGTVCDITSSELFWNDIRPGVSGQPLIALPHRELRHEVSIRLGVHLLPLDGYHVAMRDQ